MRRPQAICDPEAKNAYLVEAQQFASSLAEGLNDQDGEYLFVDVDCPG